MKMEGINCITPAIATPILEFPVSSQAKKLSSNCHKTSISHHTETAKRCTVMLGFCHQINITSAWSQGHG